MRELLCILQYSKQVGTEKDLSHLDTSLKEQFAEKHIPEKVNCLWNIFNQPSPESGELQSLPSPGWPAPICSLSLEVNCPSSHICFRIKGCRNFRALVPQPFCISKYSNVCFLERGAGWYTGFQWLGRFTALTSPPPTPALDWLKTVNRCFNYVSFISYMPRCSVVTPAGASLWWREIQERWF